MKNRWFYCVVAQLLVLSACHSATPPAETPSNAPPVPAEAPRRGRIVDARGQVAVETSEDGARLAPFGPVAIHTLGYLRPGDGAAATGHATTVC